MFRNDCFDMVVNINDRDIILSNEKTKEDVARYIESLSKFYKITPITIEKKDWMLIIYPKILFYRLLRIKRKINLKKTNTPYFK